MSVDAKCHVSREGSLCHQASRRRSLPEGALCAAAAMLTVREVGALLEILQAAQSLEAAAAAFQRASRAR